MILFDDYILPFKVAGYKAYTTVTPDDLDRLSVAFSEGKAINLKSGQLENVKPAMLRKMAAAIEAGAQASVKADEPEVVKMTLDEILNRAKAYALHLQAGGE